MFCRRYLWPCLAVADLAWENWQRHPLTGTGGDTYRIVYQQEEAEDAQEVLHHHEPALGQGIFAFLAFAAFSVGLLALAAYNALYGKRSVRSRAIIAGTAPLLRRRI